MHKLTIMLAISIMLLTACTSMTPVQPDRFIPTSCQISSGFSCEDWKADESDAQVRFHVVNVMGSDVEGVAVDIESESCSGTQTAELGAIVFRERAQAVFQCANELSEQVEGDITITYTRKGEIESHRATGIFVLTPE